MKLRIFKSDINGQWHWNLRARNGRIVACGGEGYKQRAALIRTLHRIFGKCSAERIHAQVHKQASP